MANFAFTKKEQNYLIFIGGVIVVSLFFPQWAEDYSLNFLSVEKSNTSRLKTEIEELSLNLDGIEDERLVLLANQEDYIKWVKRGVVQSQDPVIWIKKIKEIREDRKLFPIKFNFEDEFLHQSESSHLTKDSTVFINTLRMNFEMEMLHDLDLFMLITSLRKVTESKSLFFPIECSIDRVENDFKLARRANLKANCDFDWVSVKDPDKKDKNIVETI